MRLIPALYFTPTMNDILRLDPSSNENHDVSFAPHKRTENTTSVFGIYQKLSLKMRKILLIDKLKCPKRLVSKEKKQKSFPEK